MLFPPSHLHSPWSSEQHGGGANGNPGQSENNPPTTAKDGIADTGVKSIEKK